MRVLKRFTIALLFLVMSFALVLGVSCKPTDNTTDENKVTVTFMVEGEQYGEKQTLIKGRRITEPQAPTFSSTDYIFTGWYTAEDFAEDTKWEFRTGVVNADMTLYAGYRVISAYVTDVKRAEEAVTSKLVWTQSAASAAEAYEVIITNAGGTSVTLTGSVAFDAENYVVTFTPDTIPQGGKYSVSVKDTTKAEDVATAADIAFGGEGTENNPYLVYSALDFTAINQADVAEGTYFKLADDITIETTREDQSAYTFNGTLYGEGKLLTLENSNTAAIYKVGEQGYVYNVRVAGSVSTSANDSVGIIADYNAGKIEKINTTASVESSAGMAGSKGLANALNAELTTGRGIAGGVVGTNLATGIISNCKITTESSATGTVKAKIAGGTIVGLNYGSVELCTSNGCFGAWNSKETGKSTSAYSYGGGIAGINAGSITKCAVDGASKILAQRLTSNDQAADLQGANNANIGGIAGYNMQTGVISESYFAGIRVHGDENVGGIVGLNEGTVSNTYVEGAYKSTSMLVYIGGRTNIGGIAGSNTGTVKNSFVTANVYAYGDGGVAYAVANNAENCVYLTANPNAASKNDGALNGASAALTAPVGNGNVAITVENGAYDGQTDVDFALAESYLATVNGDNKFVFDGATIQLAFSMEVVEEATIEVDLYQDGVVAKTVKVAETGASIDAPAKKGFKFIGWSLTEGGEIAFEPAAVISLYDLAEYTVDGKAKLYANYEEVIANEGLVIAIWSRYIDEAQLATIEEGFAAYMKTNNLTFEVTYQAFAEHGVADFGAAVNAASIDVILGAGANISSSGGVSYVLRAKMIAEGLTDRYSVLLTETDRALTFYAWSTGLRNVSATVNFVVNGETTSGEVNELYGAKVKAPEITAAEGFVFKGWATVADALEATLTASEYSYADVEALLSGGSVTLYAVFVEYEVPPEVKPDTTLRVSVWTKGGGWVTADEMASIEAGFKAYLTEQGLDVATLTITFVETTTADNKVAGLGEAVNTDGKFDFIIGCGNNVDSTGGVTVIDKQTIAAGHIAAERYVAKLTNNTLATQLYTYLTTEKVVSTPDPEPEPEVKDTTLRVSVWTKGGGWVTADEMASIEAGFKAYLTAQGWDVSKLTIEFVETRVDGNGVADLGAAVNTDGKFDFIIGCGENVTTKGGVTTLEKTTIATGHIAAERYVARLTDNDLAVLLYAYLTAAKA